MKKNNKFIFLVLLLLIITANSFFLTFIKNNKEYNSLKISLISDAKEISIGDAFDPLMLIDEYSGTLKIIDEVVYNKKGVYKIIYRVYTSNLKYKEKVLKLIIK